jgi:hypothetical protein
MYQLKPRRQQHRFVMHDYMNRHLLILIILIFVADFVTGQNKTVKTDSVQYDQNLSDTIFNNTDSIFNDLIMKKVSINAACVTDNSLLLNTCDCFVGDDTIYIELQIADTRSVNIFQSIKINKGKYTTLYLEQSPLSFDLYAAYPIKQKLVLQSDRFELGNMIKGYIEFEGKGKYTKDQIELYNSFPDSKKMTKEEIERGFSATVKGYFKCKIKKK